MITVYITTPSDLHGPNSCHAVAAGRTLAEALAHSRKLFSTYGPLSPGRIFYVRRDGIRRPLITI